MSFIGISNNIWVGSPGTGGGNPFGWVLTSGTTKATLDIDFVHGLAFNGTANVSPSSLLSCTRATPAAAYYTNADGTLSTFAANILRYGSNGLLVEEARTNICIQSQTFDNTAWSANLFHASINANAVVAPDGTLTADAFIEDNTNNLHQIAKINETTTNVSWTWSVYAKPAGRTWIEITAFDGSGHDTYFNLSGAGSVGTNAVGSTSSIEALANGWYRCIITRTAAAGSNSGFAFNTASADNTISYQGDGVSGTYLWGAQLELGAFATSYIPTTTASVTRAADTVAPGAGVFAAIQGAAGTIYGQFASVPLNASASVIAARSDTDNRYMYISSVGELDTFNGTTQLVTTNTYASGSAKGAIAFDGSGRSACLNAGTVATDANSFGTATDASYLGARNGPTSYLNGYLKRFALWNSRLSNGAMQTLTT